MEWCMLPEEIICHVCNYMNLHDIASFYYHFDEKNIFTPSIWISISHRWMFKATTINKFMFNSLMYDPEKALIQAVKIGYEDGAMSALMYKSKIPKLLLLKYSCDIRHYELVDEIIGRLSDVYADRSDITLIDCICDSVSTGNNKLFRMLISSELIASIRMRDFDTHGVPDIVTSIIEIIKERELKLTDDMRNLISMMGYNR